MKYFEKMTKSKKLLKYSFVKDKIRKEKDHLKNYKIELPIKNELDYFYFEMFTTALRSKEMIEAKFIAAYDDMRDYWTTLTYQQKQHLINIELLPVMEKLPFIQENSQLIYIPFFDERLNRIYENEMVLFELKQYNALRFDFKQHIQHHSFTQTMANPGFTSLQLVKSDENSYYAYAVSIFTLYHLNKKEVIHAYQFDCDVKIEDLSQLCDYLSANDEKQALKLLFEHQLVDERKCSKIKKKLEKM